MTSASGRRTVAVLALLLLLFAGRLVDTARRKSFTFDEPHYVGTGLYLWRTGDYRWAGVLAAQAPLAFHLGSLGLLALDLHGREPKPTLGFDLLRASDVPIGRLRLLARLPFIALAVWGGLLAFLWAREVAGDAAGLVAAFCYTFSPTILANGFEAHSDVTVTVFYLQTLYTFWRWYARPTAPRLAVAGLSLGLALAAKLSATLLPPMLGLLLLGTALAGRPAPGAGRLRRLLWAAAVLGALAAVAVAVLWLAYGGSFRTAAEPGEPDWGWPLPAYVRAFLFDHEANLGGRTTYLLGRFSREGWWWFFPVAFAVKTPLGMLALLALAASRRGAPRVAAVPAIGPFLGVAAAVYAGVACFVLKVPLGIRYVLPLFPLMHVFVGTRLAGLGASWRRAGALAAGAWLAVASLSAHPDYLAYFNEAAGGPAGGHRILLESNLDWGQDLTTLARWLRARGNPPVWLAYFGREDPRRYGIQARPLPGCRPVTGLVAISRNVRAGLYQGGFGAPPAGCFDWLDAYQPVGRAGWSILVYDVPPA
jgi:4-amino-4-deoxy-L-arabinose transferase-like glycosyltransferase